MFVEAVLLKEDRWFYWHPGVNPMALTRAAARTYGGNRQGGSTLTMQLARLLYRLNTRTPAGKARQVAAALWLERRYSKHDLLEAYLNVAPFGGNIEGVGAASRIYFGKSPDRLTLGEALTLAVVPQSPASRAAARRHPKRSLLAARARLGADWLARSGARADDADADRRQIELPILARPQFSMPWQAPHFVDALLADRSDPQRDGVVTTLDAGLAARPRDPDPPVSGRAERSGTAQRGRHGRGHARHGRKGVGGIRGLLERERWSGERRVGQAVARIRVEAVHLRAGARSGRAASAHDAARCAVGLRPVHAGELRRTVCGPGARRRKR